MIISLRFKNFYSLREETVLDFNADVSSRKSADSLSENLIPFKGDKFINVIGLFGSNAAGKSNLIKAFEFCRNLILTSHLNNEGDEFKYEPFKFGNNHDSEFYIDFVHDEIEYEYCFLLSRQSIISEELYYYPKNRRALVFKRNSSGEYDFGRGVIGRPSEVAENTGAKTLFLSRGSSMGRPVLQQVFRFFLNEISVGLTPLDFNKVKISDIETYKPLILKALEISDSDICDIRVIENIPGQISLQSFHKEDPSIPFNFEREESEGTRRLFALLLLLLRTSLQKTTIFLDEIDIKLHLRLVEFIIDVVRASKGAQLVFTSHNPALINPSSLRPEQIVFVTKQNNGNSEFVALSEYEGIKKGFDIQKAYLQGRFDAVPYIGNAFSVVSELLLRNEK